MIITKVGERTYEFGNIAALNSAKEIYANAFDDQNTFEDAMEEAGIDFTIDMGEDWVY